MTRDEVAGLLAMRRSTIDDDARRGLLPSLKLGRHRRQAVLAPNPAQPGRTGQQECRAFAGLREAELDSGPL